MAKAPAKGAAKKATKKTMTKSQFVAHLADKTSLTKKQIDAVLVEIVNTATDQLKAAGVFVLPGVARLKRTHVEAKKGGIEKVNQLTGAKYVTQDKPAHYKVKMLPIKAFKTALL